MNCIKFLFSIVIIGAFFSCQEAGMILPDVEEQVEVHTISESFGAQVNHSFIGRVINEHKAPISNVTIKIGSSTTTTDSRGVFIINEALVFERFAYIKATKSGFINASRSLVPVNGINRVTIMMLNLVSDATVNSGEIQSVSLLNGASITLKGEYENINGQPYSGSVDVKIHYLDPSNDVVTSKMPGMLLGENSDNEARILQSFGMFSVVLKGSAGNELQLAKSSSAEITIPLDTELLAVAPQTIKLWHFEEDNGYWTEDGTAELVDNHYVGTIKNLSFWNAATSFSTVKICMHVKETTGNPVANQLVKLAISGYPYPQARFTNNEGDFCAFVPSNTDIVLKAYHASTCGTAILHEENIGAFADENEITINISLNSIEVSSEIIQGVFNNCAGDLVSEGYVLLGVELTTFVEKLTNGNFKVNLIRCQEQNSFSVQGVDINSEQTTDEMDYSFTSPITDIGTHATCN